MHNRATTKNSGAVRPYFDRAGQRWLASTGMFPAGYNNAYQILQRPGYVVILSEMIREARVILVYGRPYLP
jgi:hypothetical protein